MKHEPYIAPPTLGPIDRWCRRFVLVAAPVLVVLLLTGCATVADREAELRAHEERHCDGWEHTGTAPFYVWTQTRAPSAKPWFYVRVDDPDAACRSMGADAKRTLLRIDACAQWHRTSCTIILPRSP